MPVGQLEAAPGAAGRGARARTSFFQATISSMRSVWTRPSAAVNSLIRKLRPVDLVLELAVVAELARRTRSARRRAETSTPPSPVEIVLVA